MKRFILILFVAVLSLTAVAQTTYAKEDLLKLGVTESQIAVLNAEKRTAEVMNVGSKWVGLGKEIGAAVNESLVALTKTAGDFSETKLGKFTMILVAYKIVGSDMLQVLFGLLWIAVVVAASFTIHWRYARDKRFLTKECFGENGKIQSRTYETVKGHNDYKVAAVAVLIVGLVLSIPIMTF
jgi:hypothetical protein